MENQTKVCIHHYIIDDTLLGKCRKCNAKKQFPVISWDEVNPWREYPFKATDTDIDTLHHKNL